MIDAMEEYLDEEHPIFDRLRDLAGENFERHAEVHRVVTEVQLLFCALYRIERLVARQTITGQRLGSYLEQVLAITRAALRGAGLAGALKGAEDLLTVGPTVSADRQPSAGGP
jgi:hypothetical protein